jgi:hypothetical protein
MKVQHYTVLLMLLGMELNLIQSLIVPSRYSHSNTQLVVHRRPLSNVHLAFTSSYQRIGMKSFITSTSYFRLALQDDDNVSSSMYNSKNDNNNDDNTDEPLESSSENEEVIRQIDTTNERRAEADNINDDMIAPLSTIRMNDHGSDLTDRFKYKVNALMGIYVSKIQSLRPY